MPVEGQGGLRRVCVEAFEGNVMTQIQCRAIIIPNGMPFGNVDSMTVESGNVRIVGWGIDRDAPEPSQLMVRTIRSANDYTETSHTTGVARPDVLDYYRFGANRGFNISVPVDRSVTSVCIWVKNAPGSPGQDQLLTNGCQNVRVP